MNALSFLYESIPFAGRSEAKSLLRSLGSSTRSILLGSILLAAPSLHAATYFWDDDDLTSGFGTAGFNIGTWAGPTAGPVAGWSLSATGEDAFAAVTTTTDDFLNFGNGATGLGAGTITVSGTVATGGITFSSGSGAITLSGGTINLAAATTITVDNSTNTIGSVLSGASTGLTKVGTGTLILSGANTYANTVISAGTLQIGAGGTTGPPGTGTVLNNAALSFNRTNQITVGNVISGSGSVTNLGSGNLEITGNNTYGGGTSIDNGILILRTDTGARLGSGTVTVASGASYMIWAPGVVTLTNNIVLNGLSGKTNRPALNHDGGGGKVTLSGTVTLNATSNIGVGGNSNNDMDITGVVSGLGGITVEERAQLGGNRTLTLAGANTYTGPTTVTGGTLKAGIASVANVSGAFGKNSAVTLANTAGVILNITGFNTQIGSLTGGGTTGGNVTLGSAVLSVGGDNTSPAAYAGVISGAGGLTKIGSGTQILSGTNTYTGTTSVNAGALTLAGSSTGTLGAISVGATLNIQTGTYTQGAGGFYVGANGTGIANQTGGAVSWNNNGLQLLIGNGGSAGTYNLSGGSVTTAATGVASRGVMLGVNDNSSATFNLSGTGNLTVGSTNRLMIGRSDAAAPGTTNLFSQTGGTATISNLTIGGPAGGASGANSTLSLSGGTFTAAAFPLLSNGVNDVSTINIGGTAVVTLPNLPTARGSGATATMNFDGGTLKNSATGTFITGLTNAFIKAGGASFDTSLNSTTISQNLLTHGSSLGGGLTKLGANTLTLTGANTYTGGTTISAGTLLVSNATGSGLGTGNAIVNGGILGGSGSFTGNVTVNSGGTLAPGSSIESLGGGGFTLTGGTLAYEINTSSTSADLLFATSASAALSISGSPALSIMDLGADVALANGTKFTLISYTDAGGWNSGTFSGYGNGSSFTLGNNMWLINYADNVAGSNFSSEAVSSGDRFVTITVIPEPSSAALLVLGLGGLLARQSRRRKQSAS